MVAERRKEKFQKSPKMYPPCEQLKLQCATVKKGKGTFEGKCA
jgi:hypothetical protein